MELGAFLGLRVFEGVEGVVGFRGCLEVWCFVRSRGVLGFREVVALLLCLRVPLSAPLRSTGNPSHSYVALNPELKP